MLAADGEDIRKLPLSMRKATLAVPAVRVRGCGYLTQSVS